MTMYTEPETHQARQEWLYSRVMTYRLLSEMLERKPTLSKLIEWKKEASKINRLFTNDYALLHTLENTMLNDIMQYARQECAEYSQLFEQDQHVSYPPQASYYLTNEQGRTAYEAVVNAVYARAGIAFKKMDHETDDHIGIELEFMALLAERSAETDMHSSSRKMIAQMQIEFLEHYLIPWVPSFCAELGKTTCSPLYREWAQMLPTYLQHDVQELQQIVNRLT
ncbi:molecular chaperone TorD family protein [Paenibacillus sp. PK4536]|uniref:TorD/DmsD family molecular chaperone n=1 Tax=Paenibacillus sp. PK4536 TaxID=3024576 RepID=UPI0023590BDA|nr:molecular chaperone TorD family protein [Paenibacillus sp. PK4536]WIM39890.1 molecular chaperone TorD family protein [Paenibacillus sp. PK4536]